MAGFEVTFNGRFWVTTEDSYAEQKNLKMTYYWGLSEADSA